MAGAAIAGGGRVIGAGARSQRPVMASGAGTDDLAVVNAGRRYRQPVSRQLVMAQLALIRSIDMSRGFAAGINTVVAGHAVIDKTTVIHRGRQPGHCSMAGIAFLGGRQMRRSFAPGLGTVMAGTAGTVYLGMIHGPRRYRQPGCRSRLMTSLTLVRRADMGWGFAAGGGTVMTGETHADDLVMIDTAGGNRHPGGRRLGMAGVTKIARRQMCR